MTVSSDAGGKGQKEILKRWPYVEGTDFGTTKTHEKYVRKGPTGFRGKKTLLSRKSTIGLW